jgi:ribosomal protein L3 glutamine methyltransferase
VKVASARELVLDAERRFEAAGLYFGHGTDNARDEAVFLVFHALGLPFAVDDATLDTPLAPAACAAVERLIAMRIRERRPAAYLTQRMWFAGHEFHVDDNVLIPRSPIAELIRDGFAPWLSGRRVGHILDIGTGSGCIAIAAALAFPRARVDATDIAPEALAVAARNVARYGLGDRLALHLADVFPTEQTHATQYDLILANPPYVPEAEMAELPDEYRHEPRAALVADESGLAVIRRILAGAGARLRAGGILVLDAGGTWEAVEAAFPDVPFLWVDLVDGGDGVCVVEREDLLRCTGT